MNNKATPAEAAIQSVIDKRYGPYLSWHPVSEPMIWQWVEAFDDRNPMYSDAAFARTAGFPDIVSPAAMVQSWCLPSIARKYPNGSSDERPYDVLDIASRYGFSGNVAVSYDQQFPHPVSLGDVLHYFVKPIHVTPQKTTRLGTGHFITCLEEYRNQDDVIVYESRTTYFNFKGELESDTEQGDRKPLTMLRPPEEYETEVEWRDKGSDIDVDANLGELHIPITSTRIAVCALASRDWMPMHHSRESAMDQGQPDIFMNILTTGGFVGRFLTDWAGAGSTIKNVKFGLGVPNYPGDHMVLSGKVADLQQDGKEQLIVVEYEGRNAIGPHVTGSATVVQRK